MQPFLALITPVGNVGGAHPEHPIFYPPQQPPQVSNPIYNPGGPPGSAPPGYWGGGMGPGVKPQPHPEHPIYFPPEGSEPPLGFWGGVAPPYVDIGGPGPQPHPEHPIVLPPDLPVEIPPPDGSGPPLQVEWKTGWTAETGWVVVGIITEPHPTPSRKK